MTIPTPAWLQWGIAALLLVQFWLMVGLYWKIIRKMFDFFGNHMTKSTKVLERLSDRILQCPHRDDNA